MNLKEALYITLTGYGPCATFTLKTWLEARDRLSGNSRKAAVISTLGKRANQDNV